MRKGYLITSRTLKKIDSCLISFFIFLSGIGSGLSAQQSYTFTAAGATGKHGPTQNQINAAYILTNLSGSVTIVTQGIQEFTIPSSGAYGIRALGAQGFGPFGGRGAEMYGEFNFTAGQVLKLLVGQKGAPPIAPGTNQYGGGGGSFVTDMSNTPYIVAGGGGGSWAGAHTSNTDASLSTSGNSGMNGPGNGVGGAGGSGGGSASTSDGGGGIIGDGMGTAGGKAFVNGGMGGASSGHGGFGGGGGATSQNNRRCGGGGGYSGGGGAGSTTTGFPEAGGGGSYNSGTNQNNLAGANLGDGRIILTKLCNVNLNASINPMCFGDNITLSTNAQSPISWSNGSSSSSIVISPTSTATYTVSGTGAGTLACIGTAAIIVSVMPLPVLQTIVKPAVLCVGKTATLAAVGATSYTWSSGQIAGTTTVNPLSTNVYTVTGTAWTGCVNSTTLVVKVNTNSLTVSPGTTICAGETLTLSANGAVTYTWSTGNLFQNLPVSPLTNTVYSIVGTDIHNCQLTNAVSINVNTRPNVFAFADRTNVCKGETVNLTATGGNTYLWNSMATGAAISVTASIDVPHTYTLEGTDINGCSNTSIITFFVGRCTGIKDNSVQDQTATAYPNPFNKFITIKSSSGEAGRIEIIDYAGRTLRVYQFVNGKATLNTAELSNGFYYLKVHSGNSIQVLKAIKR